MEINLQPINYKHCFIFQSLKHKSRFVSPRIISMANRSDSGFIKELPFFPQRNVNSVHAYLSMHNNILFKHRLVKTETTERDRERKQTKDAKDLTQLAICW